MQGQPVLWFWGLSGHRYLALLLHDAAMACHLRLLCIDRPGQGGSTPPTPSTKVLDWPGQDSLLFQHAESSHWQLPVQHAAHAEATVSCCLAGAVIELADQLGLPHFSMVGQSCGAVFAMACACRASPPAVSCPH